MWAGGFCTLLVVPSPKFQRPAGDGVPVEVSLKVASSGAASARRAGGEAGDRASVAVAEMVLVVVLLPPALLTVSFTV
ncbi:MAG: hypothetical protein V9H25_17005 [Candidatus Competibacter sp.]